MRSESHVLRGGTLYLIGLALVATALISQPRAAGAQTGSPIADAALARLDTYGGQCWTFMQQVVAEATGRHVGPGYRQGYFDAGAIEVSASEATAGDIIQIASDAESGSWASYPGLHTAIILENLGGGVFNAIDSNQNWDEWVRLRPDYDPYAAAARYGLDVHIYRFPQGEAVTTVAWNPDDVAGTPATVDTGGDCLYLRSDAGLRTRGLGCLPDGTDLKVTGEAVAVDGYSWVPVSTPRGEGWVAAEFLSGIDVQSVPDGSDAGTVAVAAPEAASEPAAEEAASAPPAPAVAPGHGDYVPAGWIHTDRSPGCLNLRDQPGLHGVVVNCMAPYTAVRLVDESSTLSDGYVWVHVEDEAGYMGYVASEFLIP
jgi:hypothetical protein